MRLFLITIYLLTCTTLVIAADTVTMQKVGPKTISVTTTSVKQVKISDLKDELRALKADRDSIQAAIDATKLQLQQKQLQIQAKQKQIQDAINLGVGE